MLAIIIVRPNQKVPELCPFFEILISIEESLYLKFFHQLSSHLNET